LLASVRKRCLARTLSAGDEDDQFVILEEILRLEPVAAILHRIAAEDIETSEAGR